MGCYIQINKGSLWWRRAAPIVIEAVVNELKKLGRPIPSYLALCVAIDNQWIGLDEASLQREESVDSFDAFGTGLVEVVKRTLHDRLSWDTNWNESSIIYLVLLKLMTFMDPRLANHQEKTVQVPGLNVEWSLPTPVYAFFLDAVMSQRFFVDISGYEDLVHFLDESVEMQPLQLTVPQFQMMKPALVMVDQEFFKKGLPPNKDYRWFEPLVRPYITQMLELIEQQEQ